MKNVLMIGTTNIYGGVGRMIFEFCKNIDKTKIHFDFLYYEDINEREKKLIDLVGGKFYKITRYSKSPIKFYKEIVNFYKSHTYDIVHIHASTAMLIMYTLPVWGSRTKIIYHSHCDSVVGFHNYILHIFFRKIVTKYAEKKVAVSKKAARFMFGKKNISSSIILKNGIQVDKFMFCEDTYKRIRKELGVKDEFLIGHIGRFSYQKNQKFLIKVFHNIAKYESKVCLLLVGNGKDEEMIKRLVLEKGLSDKVIFYGTSNNVENLLCAMDCFVFPSNYEGLGIVAIEAQASGLPVVASTKIPNEAKISDTFISLSLTEDSIDSWTNKILNMKKITIDRKLMNTKIRDSGYDIVDVSKELEKMYLGI